MKPLLECHATALVVALAQVREFHCSYRLVCAKLNLMAYKNKFRSLIVIIFDSRLWMEQR